MEFKIIKVTHNNFDELYRMLVDFANFEKLTPPDEQAKLRLKKGLSSRYEAYIAELNDVPVGFAAFYFTYSDFLAKPILFLEDLYVEEKYRKKGIGKELFEFCARQAKKRKCGRMEWAVLDWNKNAIDFYECYKAEKQPVYLYRLDEEKLNKYI